MHNLDKETKAKELYNLPEVQMHWSCNGNMETLPLSLLCSPVYLAAAAVARYQAPTGVCTKAEFAGDIPDVTASATARTEPDALLNNMT